MSYEGYDVHLCALGHMFRSDDAWDKPKCPWCQEDGVYRIMVDETNGADPETGLCPGEDRVNALEVEEAEQTAVCNMGHQHITLPARYRIPR
jgi:hypothetical protein